MAKKGGKSAEEELLNTLDDFTSEENWDKFFSIKGADDSFEWYAEWPNLKDPLLSQLSSTSLDILVPGCGNSRLSEHLYDAGFHSITNIDFSKVVISDMLRRNIRSRPQMRWRVMDMTHMQLEDEVFDAVLDKGGLDALMEPDLGHKLGAQYLLEVKRVLRTGGRFICLTLAESHVLDVLFSKFRLGWKMNIHVIPQKLSNKLQTFMVVVEKERSAVLHEITSSFDHSSLYCDKNQARGLFHALDTENKIRSEKCVDILHSLEDLQLGAEGGLEKLIPGRRLQLTLGEDGHSRFSYKAVLLDAQGQSDQFLHHCGIFLVPKIRAHEWLFSSEEGQWMIVESSKAARLVMVILDARHSLANLDDIQTDLSPLVKHLAPVTHDDSAQIPFMMAGDGIKQREIVHQVTSAMTGPIIVEDVVYENIDTSVSSSAPSKDMKFRRLTFQRSSSLVQSEAHLISERCKNIGQMDNKKTNSILKSKKKVNRKRSTAVPLTDESRTTVVDHQYLASSYHVGIISGFMLVVSNLLSFASSEQRGKTIIVGLGAGLLPMFLHECMPFLDIEVVELDPTVLILARQYFGFIEDTQLKVHVRNGIEFVQNFASMAEPSVLSVKYQNGSASSEEKSPSNGSGVVLGPKSSRIDILIVDVDSSDSSSGLTCPHPDFVEVSFLNSVKETLSEGGLFVINLVSRSASIREKIISRIKEVFNHLYSLHLEEDVNEVIFALHTESTVTEGSFPDAAIQLEKLLKSTNLDIVQQIIDTTKKIKVL